MMTANRDNRWDFNFKSQEKDKKKIIVKDVKKILKKLFFADERGEIIKSSK